MREKFSHKMVSESIRMWYNMTQIELTGYDASDMLSNVTDFVLLLNEWDEKINEKNWYKQ
ncbi:hypothetical protein F6V30_07940 [Oryzomonas sagensis]|uniref:Uncharacterized protein n=1 Tax=Oryzomonas sagensis TaxID=2603857 RepID=A0ABQ6TN66_9BACT|nr:hypothetical protein [Oryzomonas sagensis]KAB0670086.1 hypothetical protein F6V30_07940 [Oryzomonas sagensis]